MNNYYQQLLSEDYQRLPDIALAQASYVAKHEIVQIQEYLEEYRGDTLKRRYMIANWLSLIDSYHRIIN